MRNVSDVQVFKNYINAHGVARKTDIPLFVDVKKTPITNYLMSEAFYRGQKTGIEWVSYLEDSSPHEYEEKIKIKLLEYVVVHGTVVLTEQRIINNLSTSYLMLQDKVEAERLQPEMGKSLDEVESLGLQSVLYWALGII